jgi:NAD(P)H-dependent glutamate synthase small subunit
MGKPTGFLETNREDPSKRKVADRIRDFREFELLLPADRLQKQASRCMDCGVPYCHAFGCPLWNRIPDFNHMVYLGQWQRALDILHETNNFPEFTGRLCPAPCETACTLSINQSPVTIRHIELQIAEWGWREGAIKPEPAVRRTHKKVAVVGSGPAGLAAAQQLARMGHEPVVFEKADKVGGLLRYGIPDFKLEKWMIDRRLDQMKAEGAQFETQVDVGGDVSARYLKRTFDAVLIAAGATVPRELDVPGHELMGIHYAMDYLTLQNRLVDGQPIPPESMIHALNRYVVVIGGGDTGSDCVGTARRQGAKNIKQIEILPNPPEFREPANPWPTWPNIMRTSSSQEEGCERMWSVSTKAFLGDNKYVTGLHCAKLEWSEPDALGRRTCKEIPGSDFEIETDLVLLATGFVHVENGPLVQNLELNLDGRGNIVIDAQGMTSSPGVFAAGDSVQGASLVVKAIQQGRQAAEAVDRYLSGSISR